MFLQIKGLCLGGKLIDMGRYVILPKNRLKHLQQQKLFQVVAILRIYSSSKSVVIVVVFMCIMRLGNLISPSSLK